MRKFFNFLMVGLVFSILNVATVSAESAGAQCVEKDNPKKISKCYRNALLEHKPELKPFGCGKKKNGWDEIARGNCLRDLLNEPAGDTSGIQESIDQCIQGARTVYNNPTSGYEQGMVERCQNGGGLCNFVAGQGVICP